MTFVHLPETGDGGVERTREATINNLSLIRCLYRIPIVCVFQDVALHAHQFHLLSFVKIRWGRVNRLCVSGDGGGSDE